MKFWYDWSNFDNSKLIIMERLISNQMVIYLSVRIEIFIVKTSLIIHKNKIYMKSIINSMKSYFIFAFNLILQSDII